MNYTCTHCGRALTASPEPEAGDWIIRCLSCGARNIVIPILKLVGWRWPPRNRRSPLPSPGEFLISLPCGQPPSAGLDSETALNDIKDVICYKKHPLP
jgi:DNA-directed RNA polymerase subunit RPC12/RpoP